MDKKFSKIIEWSVWANLDSYTDLELILLKGHLFLEVFIDNLFYENGLEKYTEFSFYRKVKALEKLAETGPADVKHVFLYLFEINKLRNKLAHEFLFDAQASKLENWSRNILHNLECTKFTKQTYRTKIVHAFSTLALAVTKMKL